MKTIQPFIDLGWHTVPLKGELKRLADGDKTVPVFEKGWRNKYQDVFNKQATALGGAITGAVSGIIAIDCDNESTFNTFKALDPDYDFIFESKGKGKTCGTFIYKYEEELEESFSINDGKMALDFYSNRGFVYLPTEANKTKVTISELPEVKEIPETAKILLIQLAKSKKKSKEEVINTQQVSTGMCLYPLVKQAVELNQYTPNLFRILTPKSFREEEEYLKSGALHPKYVPEGRGSEYLSKVSAILGADISIDEDMYIKMMTLVNGLWDDPMDDDKFTKTILDPMLNHTASVDGKVIWNYDENWRVNRFIIPTKDAASIEIAYDPNRKNYYMVDEANQQVSLFSRETDLISHIHVVKSRDVANMTKPQILSETPLVDVISAPNKPFGFNESENFNRRLLNTFKQTPELVILHEPENYKDKYTKPVTTLKYLETLIPEKLMRDYVLSFIRTKMLTFKYSPVVLYFLGVQGSGKDVFVSIIEKFMGNVTRPSTTEFLEKYNTWLMDTYFVQLDEYGDQLSTVRDKITALGILKSYTGKQKVQIRAMRTDGFDYLHNATFIMTANRNPLMLDEGERRLAFMSTPNVLASQDWVKEAGGIANVVDKIHNETKDFAYYLATKVSSLSNDDYVTPPLSQLKDKLIADSMYAEQRIAYALKKEMYEYLAELGSMNCIESLTEEIAEGKIKFSTLADLFAVLTRDSGKESDLRNAIRVAGIKMHRTTIDYQPEYTIHISSGFSADEEGENWDENC